MDVVSDKNIDRLVATRGTTRVYEQEDGTWLQASGGTVAWRNNNPGNLKFGYADSADTTVHTSRSKEQALHDAQKNYPGVVALDQWGNAVFKNYEAGRDAQESLLQRRMGDKTVEELVKSYSKADYSGATHHDAQVKTIYKTAEAEGVDLHGKKVKDMTDKEIGALCDGLSKAEGWKAGTTHSMPPQTPEQLEDLLRKSAGAAKAPAKTQAAGAHSGTLREGARGDNVGELQSQLRDLGYTGKDHKPIAGDKHFGAHTKEAVEAFQTAHGLKADGIVGEKTLDALHTAHQQSADTKHASAPLLNDAAHPANGMFKQAEGHVQRLDAEHGRPSGPHTGMIAASLTASAVAAGMHSIDHVALNADASRAYAMQGDASSPFKQHAEVDVVKAAQTPLAQSSAEAMQQHGRQAEVAQQSQQQSQAQQHAETQSQAQVQQQSPMR